MIKLIEHRAVLKESSNEVVELIKKIDEIIPNRLEDADGEEWDREEWTPQEYNEYRKVVMGYLPKIVELMEKKKDKITEENLSSRSQTIFSWVEGKEESPETITPEELLSTLYKDGYPDTMLPNIAVTYFELRDL